VAQEPNKTPAIPKVMRIEPLEKRVLYSADAAPLLALVDSDQAFSFKEQAPERALWKALDENADTTYLSNTGTTNTNEIGSITELVIVDSTQPDIDALKSLLQRQLDSNNQIAIVTLQSASDPIAMIASILARYDNLQAVHIISHAADGEMQFGNSTVNQTSLLANKQILQQWGESLHVDGDILLYGCNLSGSADGKLFAKTLATLTNADVASSSDITGHALNNGDWDLEITNGEIETPVIAQAQVQNDWAGSLDITTGLIHHWKFDGNGNDSAGAAPATLINGVGSSTGLIGNAGDFDGDGPSAIKYAEVSAANFTSLGTGDFSVALWMNTSSGDSSDQLIGNKVSGTDGFTVALTGAGQVIFSISDGATSESVTSATNVADGDWRHIVASRSGSSLELHIYNRATGSTDFFSSTISDPSLFVGSSSALHMGSKTSNAGDFDGLIDDVRIYNRAISTADAAELIDLAGSEQVLSINNTVTISDSGSQVIITSSDLLTVDSDTPDVNLVYVIQLLPGASELSLNGTPLANGMSFTQADINNGLVSISATGMAGATADSIAISVDDGQGTDTLFALDVVINPNVEQLVSKNTSVTVDFAGAPLSITNNELLAVDPDNTDSELVFVLSVQQPSNVNLAINGSTLLVGDSFTQTDINNGLLSVVSTALPGPPAGEYVYFTLDDGVGQVTNTFIYVNINTSAPLNTAPLAGSAIFSMLEDDPNPAGDTINNLFGPVFTDADVGDSMSGILINSVPNPPQDGAWQYSTDGTNWYALILTVHQLTCIIARLTALTQVRIFQ